MIECTADGRDFCHSKITGRAVGPTKPHLMGTEGSLTRPEADH